jgi:hypothetical protein
MCLKSEVSTIGGFDRVVKDERGRYELPEIGYVVIVRKDANGRQFINV